MSAADPLALQAERHILVLRSQRVMLDFDLAILYGVETRALKQAVRRNAERFPSDFMFELNEEEIDGLVSQTVIPGRGKLGGSIPYAFTEQGVAHALQRPAQRACGAGQHRHHAGLRPLARAARNEC